MERIRQIIAFRGRVGDRAAGNISGAVRLAQYLAVRLEIPLRWIGTPAPPKTDNWPEALETARPDLQSLAVAVGEDVATGFSPVCILPTDAASIAVHSAALRGSPNVTLAWFDAHADFNTPDTTGSGYLGGMALAASGGLWDCGFGPATNPDRVVVVGARAIDIGERALLDKHSVIRIAATGDAPRQVRQQMAKRPQTFVHLDLDCLEPGHVPTQYQEPNGFQPQDVRNCLSAIVDESRVVGLSISEYFCPNEAVEDRTALETVFDILTPVLQRY
jgi:arginase/N-omega-hydroxy-L-arginine amidinohydrolase